MTKKPIEFFVLRDLFMRFASEGTTGVIAIMYVRIGCVGSVIATSGVRVP